MTKKATNRLAAVLAIAVLATACAGKDAVAPEDTVREAFGDFRAEVAAVVDDPVRRNTVLMQVARMESEYEALQQAVAGRRAELRALNLDYDATREQFGNTFEKHDAQIRAVRKAVTATHRALAAAVTDEWAALSKASTKAMKTLVTTLQTI